MWAASWPGSGSSWGWSSWPRSRPSPGSLITAITGLMSWPGPCSASPSPWSPPLSCPGMKQSRAKKARSSQLAKQRNKLDSWDGQSAIATGKTFKENIGQHNYLLFNTTLLIIKAPIIFRNVSSGEKHPSPSPGC